MEHILFNSPAYGEEITNLVGTDLPPKSSSIVRVKYGRLLGGAVYFNKFGTVSISVHVASRTPHWLTRDLLFMLFDYPFNQLGVKRLFGFVASDNPHAIKFNHKLGFRDVNWIPDMLKGGATCIVMRMDREDCRFLSIKPRVMTRNYH